MNPVKSSGRDYWLGDAFELFRIDVGFQSEKKVVVERQKQESKIGRTFATRGQ